MTEYIDKQAVIDEIEEWYDLYPDSDTTREALSLLKKAIKKISPEDVRPVVRGRWIPKNADGSWRVDACSACKKDTHYLRHASAYDFCPNCGADMRGEG